VLGQLKPEPPEKVPGHAVSRPVDLPAGHALGIGARSLAGGLDVAEVSSGPVKLAPERVTCH
jgi:hypothetical protein